MKIKIFAARRLKKRGPFPEVVLPEVEAEVPEGAILELEKVNFYPFDPRKTNLVLRLKKEQTQQ